LSWISELFTSSVGTVVEKAGEAIDRLVTSDKERLQLKNELVKIQLDAASKAEEIDLEYAKQVTTRHENDMKSDSWLSKNIRPLALIYILVMYSLLSISSGFKFEVTPSYVELLGNWGMLIMSFYFAGRTVEKIKSIGAK
jgi:hypothetical protein